MVGYFLIIWILIQMKAPAWTLIVAAIGVTIKILGMGVEIGKKAKGQDE